MPALAVVLPLATLLALRLWAQHRLKQRAPLRAPAAGGASVAAWFALFVATLALTAAAAWRGSVTLPRFGGGLALIGGALTVRGLALARLGGLYHEGIAVRRGHRVVREGVYRYLRHPLHLALVVELAGLALIGGEPAGALAAALAVGVLLLRNAQEERALTRALGAPYRAYLASGAWDLLDLVPPLRPQRRYRWGAAELNSRRMHARAVSHQPSAVSEGSEGGMIRLSSTASRGLADG